MFRTSPSNKNIILSIILLLVFLLSTGAMLPAQQGTNTARNSIQVSSPTSSPSINPTYPVTTQVPTVSNVLSTSQEAKVASTNAVQSVASTTSYSGPSSYNTTTVYDNGANFNEASSSLLPFAERYRINSTLNGWVNANGMTTNYVPINQLVYTHQNLAGGGVINSSAVGTDFPVILRFIPNYPVTFVLNASNTNTGIVVYNSNNIPAPNGTSTNQVNVNIVTIVPTTQNPYYIYLVNGASSSVNVTVTIQQYVTPNFITPYMGDQGTGGNYSTYDWFFNSSITSFGVLAPNTLDLGTLTYNRSDTATVDYSAPNYQTYAYSSVVDNFTNWLTSVPSFFNLTSQTSCNDALTVQNRCQSFLPMFFYNSSDPTVLNNGMWIPSLEQNHVFGANPQIMRFLGYFGNAPTLGVNKIIVVNSANKTVLDLSNQFTGKNLTTANIAPFVEQLTVGLPTQTLFNGTYSLEIFDGIQMLYSYPFSVNSALYGNYHTPVVNFGYKTVTFPSQYTTLETAGTIVYANATDLDASVGGLQLSYTTTTNATWTTGNMVWLEPNHWGYVIPVSKANLANVSITVLESAPSDQGKLRLQVQTQFKPDVIDLSTNTTTTMQVTVIPRGLSTTNPTAIKFVNDNTFNLAGVGGVTLTTPTGYFVYTIANNVAVNTPFVFNVTITPRIAGLLQITSIAVSGTVSETQNVYFDVLSGLAQGVTAPTVSINFVTNANGNFNSLYPYLNSTYPVTVQYEFTGGAPTSNFQIYAVGSAGSLTKASVTVNANNTYPLTSYTATISMPVNKAFSASTATVYVNMTYDTITSQTVSKSLNVYPPTASIGLFDLNGNPLSVIYNKMITQLSVMVQLKFYNGTPVNPMSLTISPTGGYFTKKTVTVNATSVVNGQANVTVALAHNSNYNQPNDVFTVSLSWDGKTTTKSNTVQIDMTTSLSSKISMNLLNQTKLDPNATSNTLFLQIKSSFSFALRNITLKFSSSDGLGISNAALQIPEIQSGGEVNVTLTITAINFKFTKATYPISYTLTISGYNPYSGSISITYNLTSLISSNTTNTSTSGSSRSTPGFSVGLLFIGLVSVLIVKRKIHKK